MTTDVRDARALPEEGFHEIQLSGKQLVFLFMATTVVSVAIFLCGVLVGRGVRPMPTESPNAPVTSSNAASQPGEAGSPSGGAPADASSADAQPPSYYKDLVGENPAPDAVTPANETPSTVDTPPSAPPVAPAVAGSDAAPAAPPPSDARPASVASAEQPWIVQVTALRKRAEAQAIARRLSERGYKAFVLDPQPGSTALYRVRVGPFSDLADAEQTMQRLSSEEQFKPWISR